MILSLKNISKSYLNLYVTAERKVLNNLSLIVEKGEKIAIIGRSGSGKTTILNLIGTLDKPDSGEILFNGKDIGSLKPESLAMLRNREIGFVFQLHHLLPQCTLMENILIPTLPFMNRSREYELRAEILLRRMGIWELKDQKPGELSGGECQRAALVRALINNPSLLLADEPTGALDEANSQAVIELLIESNRQEKNTLVVVTHSLDIAGKMDKKYLLKEGKLVLIS